MISIPKQYASLVHIKPLSWKEVFDAWRKLEAWQESWKQHWTERGFNSWDEWRQVYSTPLKDISHLPIITKNEKILDIQRDFPKETMLTGLVYDGKIILLEGMHRANALANWNPETPFLEKITIALAQWDSSIPTLGGNCKAK